jgi:hypothetical protein
MINVLGQLERYGVKERLSIRYENLKLDTKSKIRHYDYDHLALQTGTLLGKKNPQMMVLGERKHRNLHSKIPG